jgi:hypothetical protein
VGCGCAKQVVRPDQVPAPNPVVTTDEPRTVNTEEVSNSGEQTSPMS